MKKRILAILLSLALVCTAGFAGLSVSAEDPVPLEVTGVGIFDQTPNKGIHTFNENAKLIQVTFNRDFWTGPESMGGGLRQCHLGLHHRPCQAQ